MKMGNVLIKLNIWGKIIFNISLPIGQVFSILRKLLNQNFGLLLFENLFKPRQFRLAVGMVTDFVSSIHNLKTVFWADFVSSIYNLKTVFWATYG